MAQTRPRYPNAEKNNTNYGAVELLTVEDFTNLQTQITALKQNAENAQAQLNKSFQNQLNALKNSVLVDVPVGSMIQYAGNNVPSSYLLCNGAQLKSSEYTDLYNIISTRFNQPTENNSNYFRIPNLHGWIIKALKQ